MVLVGTTIGKRMKESADEELNFFRAKKKYEYCQGYKFGLEEGVVWKRSCAETSVSRRGVG